MANSMLKQHLTPAKSRVGINLIRTFHADRCLSMHIVFGLFVCLFARSEIEECCVLVRFWDYPQISAEKRAELS